MSAVSLSDSLLMVLCMLMVVLIAVTERSRRRP